MKKLLLLFTAIFFTQYIFALSVTPTPSTLNCGGTSVNFVFDCAFTGSVLIPSTPTGVSYSGSNVKTVSNGNLSFTVTISSAAAQNFNLSFVVLSSNMSNSCAPINEAVNAAFLSTCALPPNNDCSSVIPLSISTTNCSGLSFTTNNTTSSGTIPSCAVPGYLDLFYTFNANNDTVVMEIPSVPSTVGFYGLFDDCPGVGNPLDCSIMIASGGSTYLFTNLTPGDDFVIQILFLPGNAGIDQEICLHSTTPQSNMNCPTNVVVSDSGANLPNQGYLSSLSITTLGTCTLSGNGIIFDAGTEIILNAGFDSANFDFEALISGCIP